MPSFGNTFRGCFDSSFRASITLPAGTEIDFGGVGKEYAVERPVAMRGVTSRKMVFVTATSSTRQRAGP
jgi:hypothetical protein